jgi:hypothetical protein
MCRPDLWDQLVQDNTFVVACACMAGFLMMVGSMALQFGMALTGLAICVPFQIAVSLSVGVLSQSPTAVALSLFCFKLEIKPSSLLFLHLTPLCRQTDRASHRHRVHHESSLTALSCAGIGVNWFMDARLGNAAWLFSGLSCFSMATILGTLAHVARLKDLKNKR